jgi:dephospho-CoA kinase
VPRLPRRRAAGGWQPALPHLIDIPVRTIGLTGNIAAGKSAVADRLRAHGLTVIDADALAREVVAPRTPALEAIVARWGARVLRADGTLDRAVLRSIVFADPAERTALEAITHPAIERLRSVRVAEAAARGETLVILDIPLLFEAGLTESVDRILLVDAPIAVRRQRLMHDRGLSGPEADAMIAAQRPAEAKRSRATWVIENTGRLADLDRAVDALLSQLCDA